MSDAQRDSGEITIVPDAMTEHDSDRPGRSGGRITIRCAGRTAVGQVRDHNEDNFVVANLGAGEVRPRDQVFEDEVDDRGMLFAVCDGMGGAAAGEVASQMAVDILVEAMRRGGSPKNRDGLARRLVTAVEEAGRRIFEAAQRERSRRGMGTTATVAVLVDKVMFIAEVGDSRAYLLRRGQLKQVTKDQSLVNQLIEAGHLTEDEAEAFEHSNIILQALGTSEAVQVDLTFVELRKGDRLMLCSDGLSGLVHTEMLRATLDEIKDPADCSSKLIEHAETAGGHDNITVVVVDFEGDGMAEATDSDSFGYVQYPLPLSDGESAAFGDEETTSGGRPVRHTDSGDDDADDESEGDEEDVGESLLPLSGDAGDSRANALWILGGVLALVAAVAVWFTLDPASQEAIAPQPEEVVLAPAVPPPPVAEAQEVDVNVHTDLEQGTLMVNGDDKGEISVQQSRNLKLRPGAYRFEAKSGGNTTAVTVATVRGDTPMDVFLRQMPKGTEPPDSTAKDEQAPQEPADAPAAPDAARAERDRERAAERRAARQAEREAAAEDEAEPAEPKKAAIPVPQPPPPTVTKESSGSVLVQDTGRGAPPTPAPKPAEIPENPF